MQYLGVCLAATFFISCIGSGKLNKNNLLWQDIQDGKFAIGNERRLSGCAGHPFEANGDSLFHVLKFEGVIKHLYPVRNTLAGGAPNLIEDERFYLVPAMRAFEVKRNKFGVELGRTPIVCKRPLSVDKTENVLRKVCRRRQEEDKKLRRAKK